MSSSSSRKMIFNAGKAVKKDMFQTIKEFGYKNKRNGKAKSWSACSRDRNRKKLMKLVVDGRKAGYQVFDKNKTLYVDSNGDKNFEIYTDL